MRQELRVGMFLAVLLCCSVILSLSKNSHAAVFSLPATGQTKCYNSSGAEIACAGTGQDGEKQAGIAWPNPRFSDNNNGTITDNLTGLIWTKDGGTPGPAACSPGAAKLWREASDYIKCLNTNNYLEHNDWRLPNINEMESLIDAEVPDNSVWLSTQGFTNNLYRVYCSSTTFTNFGAKDMSFAVNMQYSQMNGYPKTKPCDLWPIRTGPNGMASIQKTGQSKCYDTIGSEIACSGTGQDGEKRSGVEWPSHRFTNNGSGTVTDNLTGLMWTQDNNSPGPSICNMDIYGTNNRLTTWQNALEFIKCINKNNYLGHSDWRLPNKKELFSLLDFSNYDPILPSGHPFTTSGGTLSYVFWSSTTSTNSYSPGQWIVSFWDGSTYNVNDTSAPNATWPVRTEKTGTSGNCAATLSGSFLLHEPYFTINGSFLSLDLQYAQNSQFPSTDIMFKLANAGGVTNPSVYSSCQASALSVVGNNYVLHIPVLILGGNSYWFDLTYAPTTDGLLWFKLTNMGVN